MMAASFTTSQGRRPHVSLRIGGEWALRDDGVMRPIVHNALRQFRRAETGAIGGKLVITYQLLSGWPFYDESRYAHQHARAAGG
jgi:hypothetical protein